MGSGSVIDTHGHLWLGSEQADEASVLRLCGRYGVEKVFISTLAAQYPTAEQVARCNAATARFMARYPGLIEGMVYVNPRLPGALQAARQGLNQGMRGIKLWVESYCDNPRVWPLAALAQQYGVPLLVHAFHKARGQLTDESRGSHVAALAHRFPGTNIIMAHLGGNVYDAIHCVQGLPNVYADISGSIFRAGDLAYAVARLGAGRVLFGSDMPGSFEVCVGQVLGAGLTTSQQTRIFNGNARRLFNLEGSL